MANITPESLKRLSIAVSSSSLSLNKNFIPWTMLFLVGLFSPCFRSEARLLVRSARDYCRELIESWDTNSDWSAWSNCRFFRSVSANSDATTLGRMQVNGWSLLNTLSGVGAFSALPYGGRNCLVNCWKKLLLVVIWELSEVFI